MKKCMLSLISIFLMVVTVAQTDKAPTTATDANHQNNRDLWDTQFLFPISSNIAQTGAESDGTYIYTSEWFGPVFTQYDLAGNFIDTLMVPGLNGIRDLAYDGQYFYGSNVTEYLYVFDLLNETMIDSIFVPGVQIRSLAYNQDEDVFYTNNWDDGIKKFNRQGVVLDTIPAGASSIYGLAYDSWSIGGPYLWGYTQDQPNKNYIIQYHLPSKQRTSFYMDVSYLSFGEIEVAGGLFTQPNLVPGKVTLGGCMQNTSVWGLELTDVVIDFCYSPAYVHAELQNADMGLISWQEPRYSLLEASFNGISFPDGWNSTTAGIGWIPSEGNSITGWEVPAWDSKYALAVDDPQHPDGSSDYLITPPLYLNYVVDFELSFESFFDGTNNQVATVEYSTDGGSTWTLLYTLSPSPQWEYVNLDLTNLLADTTAYPIQFGFHSNDQGGQGSGWAIDNVMVYTADIYTPPLGYNVYRDQMQINTSLITQLSYLDQDPVEGLHEYYVRAIYDDCNDMSSSVYLHIPTPISCDPPENLSGQQSGENAAIINWSPPSSQDPHLAGYQLYRDEILITTSLVTNTTYTDAPLSIGTYSYKVSAVYTDALGNVLCESEKAGPLVVEILPPANMILGGNVFAGQLKLDAGQVLAYAYENDLLINTHQTELDGDLGYYFFNMLQQLHYYVKTVPAVQSAYYMNYVPTYHGGNIYWADATKVYLENNMYNVDIHLAELYGHDHGNGKIAGNIRHQDVVREGSPAENIPVYLLNDADQCIAFTYTNTSGAYEFPSLPYGHYQLFADVVGKRMTKVNIELTEAQDVVDDVNLMITDGEILAGDPELPSVVSYAGEVFPNPSSNAAWLEIGMQQPQRATVRIFDLKGQQFMKDQYMLQVGINMIHLDLADLHQGLYMLQINFDGQGLIHRKLTIMN